MRKTRILLREKKIDFQISGRELTIIAAPIVFWYVSLFPAVLTPDSYSVIEFTRSNSYSGFHTVLYEIFVKFVGFKGNALYLVSFVQIVLNYYALFLSTRFILKNLVKIDINHYLITSIIFSTPFFGPISMTIWKDNLHNSLILIGFFKLIEEFSRERINQKKYSRIGIFYILIAFGAMTRHEAPLVFIATGISLLLFGILLKRDIRLRVFKIAWNALLIGTVSIGGNQLFEYALVAEGVPRYQQTLSFLLDLEYTNANYPATLNPEARAVLSEISSGPSLVGAANCASPYNIWSEGFSEVKANEYTFQVLKIWIGAMRSNARDTVLKARFCRAASFSIWPFAQTPVAGYWPTTGISPNNLGYENPILTFPLYTIAFAWTYIWGVNGNLIAWPGLHLTFLLLVFMYFLFNPSFQQKFRLFFGVAGCFILIRSMILFLTTASQEFRYLSVIYYFTAPLIAALIINYINRLNPSTKKR